LGNLSTPKSVQKLQTALHAKAKAETGYRFYALYDKISREDVLAHAYAQCRSNKGAPGVDGQDFADIDAYGAERWLGELALVLREESTSRILSEECSSRRPTASSGRWASRPCGIGSA
jgi:RNA-directed DNA polymerase